MPSPTMPVESLVAGRARRSTAGNRLASLLHQEADKDDTLFMEDESDVEFLMDENAEVEDIDMGDSTSEDEGPPKEGEEEVMLGEMELNEVEREERKKKRAKEKENMFKVKIRPKVTRERKVRIVEEKEEGTEGAEDEGDERAGGRDIINETIGGRPRKKSERISWVPADVAVRSSSRTLSVANKERVHKRLQESERRRLQIIASMDAAKEKADAKGKKEMTQEERLREAAKTEKKNLKSLNRWEESENQRIAAQRARLAALHQRRIEGPIIRFYSGRAEYDGTGKLVRVGRAPLIEEVEDDAVETKAKPDEKVEVTPKAENPVPTPASQSEQPAPPAPITSETEQPAPAPDLPSEQPASLTTSQPEQSLPTPAPEKPASLPSEMPPGTAAQPVLPAAPRPPSPDPYPNLLPLPADSPLKAQTSTQSTPSIQQPPTQPEPLQPEPQLPPSTTEHTISPSTQSTTILAQPPTPAPPTYSTLNVLILENFSPPPNPPATHKLLFGTAPAPPPHSRSSREKHLPEICPITSEIARFRDPKTGIGYSGLRAYREIQRVMRGEVRWCQMLGCYVGSGDAASGVPEGFLD